MVLVRLFQVVCSQSCESCGRDCGGEIVIKPHTILAILHPALTSNSALQNLEGIPESAKHFAEDWPLTLAVVVGFEQRSPMNVWAEGAWAH